MPATAAIQRRNRLRVQPISVSFRCLGQLAMLSARHYTVVLRWTGDVAEWLKAALC